MSKFVKTAIAAMGAAVLFGALVGTASAARLSASEPRFTGTWAPMTFTEPLGGRVECPVTLEGTLHSATIAKVTYSLIGYITRATLNNASCVGGHATILQERLPWHVRYNGFEGTLPRITAINVLIVGASFQIERNGLLCLYTTTETEHASGRFVRSTTTGAITSVVVGGSILSNNNCGPFGERVRGSLSGTSRTVSALTITLI